MRDKPVNLQASVAARLRNVARDRKADFELVLRRYAIERLLYRLSQSPHRDRLVLKGAMLFAAWAGDPFRPTRDVDLLGFGESGAPAVAKTFHDICRQAVDDDALLFDADRHWRNRARLRERRAEQPWPRRIRRLSPHPEPAYRVRRPRRQPSPPLIAEKGCPNAGDRDRQHAPNQPSRRP